MARQLAYLKSVIIVHGKSEYFVVNYIKTHLRLTMKPYAKDKGAHSIQITSLMNILKNAPFSSVNAFCKEYDNVEVSGKGKNKRLENFKLYIIMDTDDCTPKQKKAYIDKTMFQGHPLYDYIVPIFNSPDLENVMVKCGIMKNKIKNSQKGEWYEKVFPVNKDKSVEDTKEDVETLNELFKKCNDTNMEEFITYCLDNIRRIG